jgi:integrase
MLPESAGRPDLATLNRALRTTLNAGETTTGLSDDQQSALEWAASHCPAVKQLADPKVMRDVLVRLDKKADGGRAAPDTIRLRRTALKSALEFAVTEEKIIARNPMNDVKGRRNVAAIREVDRRSVPNTLQARTLLLAVREVAPHLEAFFGCMYHGGLRPEEATNLGRANLDLPDDGWGVLILDGALPEVAAEWADAGQAGEVQPLKHRARGHTRTVPCNPELVALLRGHISQHGVSDSGKLFRGKRGAGRVGSSVYGRAWAQARVLAFSPEVAAGPLARRPYDLRHAYVTTMLAAGVEPKRVAEWAGHSLRVLLQVYAQILDGGEREAHRRVEQLLGLYDMSSPTSPTSYRGPKMP